jgi:polysaccharide biosynthesis transport protein
MMSFKRSLAATSESEPDLNLVSVIRVVQRRRRIILVCILFAFAASLLYLAVSKFRYRADAQLQVLREDSPATMADLTSTSGGASDPLQINLTMQTYAGILASDSLALRVIREQGLENTSEYRSKLGASASAEEKAEANRPLEETRYRREKILKRFKSHLQVSVVSGSKLISVSFDSADADLAKRVLDQLLADFIDHNFQVRFNASKKSEDWLSEQLIELRADVQRSQEEAVRLQHQTGIFGTDESNNLILGRLQTLDQELTSAEQNRIVKQSVLGVVRKDDPESISSLSTTTGQTAVPGAVNSLVLIQNLRQQESSLAGQYAEVSSKYGPNYPRVVELREQLAQVKWSIARETERVRRRAENDYKAAASQENATRSELEKQRAIASSANDLAVRYRIAKREADSKRDLYQHLIEKAKEVDVLAGLRSTNIDIVDAAHVSSSPVSPKIPMVLGLGLGSGLFLGFALAFLRDSLDGSLYDPEDVERLSGLSLLGIVPQIEQGSSEKRGQDSAQDSLSGASYSPVSVYSAAANEPDSTFTEAFRVVRTSMLLSEAPDRLKVIMITGPIGGEGKSVVSANLAMVLAQKGSRVLLIDGDLRKGTLSEKLGFASRSGLSDMHGAKETTALYPITGFSTLRFIPSGSNTKYPSEVLGSTWLERELTTWRAEFDYIIVDTTSVLGVTDAVAFSQRADGVIVVGRSGMTTKQSLVRTSSVLVEAHASLLGVVLNGADVHSWDYRHYLGL